MSRQQSYSAMLYILKKTDTLLPGPPIRGKGCVKQACLGMNMSKTDL